MTVFSHLEGKLLSRGNLNRAAEQLDIGNG